MTQRITSGNLAASPLHAKPGNAGFAVSLVKGFDPETSVRFAQATSALNATGLGSQAGLVDFDQTWKFMSTQRTRG